MITREDMEAFESHHITAEYQLKEAYAKQFLRQAHQDVVNALASLEETGFVESDMLDNIYEELNDIRMRLQMFNTYPDFVDNMEF